MTEYKLCYIEGSFAWFTTAELDVQWGDDWNDAPYEHNAGAPYEWKPYMSERGIKPYKLIEVAIHAHRYETPDFFLNEYVSVFDINRGERRIPWLGLPNYDKSGYPPIYAGESLPSFIEKIQAAGGDVFMKVDRNPHSPMLGGNDDK